MSLTPQDALFVLSLHKTATQSVYHSLNTALREKCAVFHAHSFDVAVSVDPFTWESKFRSADYSMMEKWIKRVRKENKALRALLDVRRKKTIVTIRRDSLSRLQSAMYHLMRSEIERFYDAHNDTFAPGLEAVLEKKAQRHLAREKEYYEKQFAPLGIPREAIASPFSVTRVRPDLEVVALRFASLDEDFTALCEHLGTAGIPLLRLNEAADRSLDGAKFSVPQELDRKMYAAFKREYKIPSLASDEARVA